MLTTLTIDRALHWFTGVRLLLIAVMVATVAIAWQVKVADATEDNAATFTVCSDLQGRLRMVDDADECNSNEEFLELDLATGQALEDATQDLEDKISDLESELQGQIDELEERIDDQNEEIQVLETEVGEQGQQIEDLDQTVDDQAGEIEELEGRVAALEDGQDGAPGDDGLEDRVTDLEGLLDGVSREDVDGRDTLRFAGMNLQLLNGDGVTTTTNGLGNLIVGYNEEPAFGEVQRDGSHNLVIGAEHNYSASGGLVAGHRNTISADFASVTGGQSNTASAEYGSVTGGMSNTSSALHASVSGGERNQASGIRSSVSGGNSNTASHSTASVSGGFGNTAANLAASVSGGAVNQAQGPHSSILGGHEILVDTQFGMHPEP